MPVNYDLIFNSNLDKIDDEKAELLYDQLIEYSPDQEEDVDKLRKAFNVAKCVMQVKALQTDVAIEELEEFVKKSKSNQDLNKKKLSLSSDYESQSDQYLAQIQELNNNLDVKSSELIKARKRIADLERKTDLDEKMIQELKEEVTGLQSEQQMDIQETIDDEMMMMKLREKNKQIQGLLDELKEMNNVNVELAKQIKLLKNELQQATSELKLAGDEIEKVRIELNQVQEMNRTTIKEKKYLLKEMDDLRQNLEKYESQDDMVAVKLNEKIDKLLSLMEVKDEEIDKLRLQLRQKIELLEMSDSSELIKKIQLKDEKVEYLKNQLNQAVNDMESQNKIIENLMKESQGRRKDGEEESLTYQQQIKHFETRNDQLESELKVKDDQLIEVMKIINQYEKGEYGLSKAIADLKKLRREIVLKDKKIEDLVQELNQANLELNDCKDEIDYLMESSSIREEDRADWMSKDRKERNNRLKILQLQRSIVQLEEDKINLQEELRKTQTINQDKIKYSKSDDKIMAHLKELEEENAQLQLGMKEILIGIRESDAQSDVVLDCPSLERLVELLECRSISGQLTNVIALKAELDLLRGHNQYIRMELKRLRHEHLKLIADYTQVILSENDHYHPQKEEEMQIDDESVEDEEGDTNNNNTNNNEDDENQEESEERSEDHREVVTKEEEDEEEKKEKEEEKEGQLQKVIKLQEKSKDQAIGKEHAEEEKVRKEDGQAEEVVVDDDDHHHDEEEEDEEENITVEDESLEEDTIQEVDLEGLERKKQIEMWKKQVPSQRRSEPLNLDKEIQTIIDMFNFKVPNEISITSSSTQTDDEKIKDQCSKCSQLLNYFSDIKAKLRLLEESLISGQDNYNEQIQILELENNRLENELKNHLKNDREVIMRKDEIINQLRREINQEIKKDKSEEPMELVESSDLDWKKWAGKNSREKGMFTVLQTIIDCLQARIDHKDEAIKGYQNLMKGMQENYESQIQKLMENQDRKDPIEIKTLDIKRMIDSEELEQALEKSLNELEKCKLEYKESLDQLNKEIEEERLKLKETQEENERLKLRSSLPQLTLMRKKIESLTQINEEKDNIIDKLKKNLKYEKMIRSVKPMTKKSSELIEARSEESRKQMDVMNEKLKQMSEMIKSYDIEKWESNRKYKDTVIGLKEKLRAKEECIARLEDNLAKVKKLLERHERDKSTSKWKRVKQPASANEYSQTEEIIFPTFDSSDDERVNTEITTMKKEINKLRDSRDELKILLSESIKREKMMKLSESKISYDQKRDKLLEENALLKVELRMAEYELRQQKNN